MLLFHAQRVRFQWKHRTKNLAHLLLREMSLYNSAQTLLQILRRKLLASLMNGMSRNFSYMVSQGQDLLWRPIMLIRSLIMSVLRLLRKAKVIQLRKAKSMFGRLSQQRQILQQQANTTIMRAQKRMISSDIMQMARLRVAQHQMQTASQFL